MKLNWRDLVSSRLAHMALVALAAFVVYSNTFDAPMTFDDQNYIIDNPAIRGMGYMMDAQSGRLHLTDPNLVTHFRSRILVFILFALNYAFDGLDPDGYHAVNLVIHIAA